MDAVEKSIRQLFAEIRSSIAEHGAERAGSISCADAARELGLSEREVRRRLKIGTIRRSRASPGMVRISEVRRLLAER